MTRNKRVDPVPPGVDSSLWTDPKEISATADCFCNVALNLSNGYVDPLSPQMNVIYTNAALGIELYLKSLLVERIFHPVDFIVTEDEQLKQITKEEAEEILKTSAVFTHHHSRLVVKNKPRTHDISLLFSLVSSDYQQKILDEVVKETTQIKNMNDLTSFLTLIKDLFVDRRYAFEQFIEPVPKDSGYIYKLMPLIKGMGNALKKIERNI